MVFPPAYELYQHVLTTFLTFYLKISLPIRPQDHLSPLDQSHQYRNTLCDIQPLPLVPLQPSPHFYFSESILKEASVFTVYLLLLPPSSLVSSPTSLELVMKSAPSKSPNPSFLKKLFLPSVTPSLVLYCQMGCFFSFFLAGPTEF